MTRAGRIALGIAIAVVVLVLFIVLIVAPWGVSGGIEK
jgi:hypothetical protein